MPPQYVPQVQGQNVVDATVRQLQEVIGKLTPLQAQAVQTALWEQVNRQVRGVPESFGQTPDLGTNTFIPSVPSGLPLPAQDVPQGACRPPFTPYESRDVFSRADKLGQPPVPEVSKWVSKELADYVVSLQAWAAMGSLEFSEEIGMSVRWPETILQHTLNSDQKIRSVRLLGILKAAFLEHPRVSLMIQAFCEGLSLDGAEGVSIRMMSNTTCGL